MATIIVYEEDYEQTVDMTLAPEYNSKNNGNNSDNSFKPFLNYNNNT